MEIYKNQGAIVTSSEVKKAIDEASAVASAATGATAGAIICGPLCAGAGAVLGYVASKSVATEIISDEQIDIAGASLLDVSFDI